MIRNKEYLTKTVKLTIKDLNLDEIKEMINQMSTYVKEKEEALVKFDETTILNDFITEISKLEIVDGFSFYYGNDEPIKLLVSKDKNGNISRYDYIIRDHINNQQRININGATTLKKLATKYDLIRLDKEEYINKAICKIHNVNSKHATSGVQSWVFKQIKVKI